MSLSSEQNALLQRIVNMMLDMMLVHPDQNSIQQFIDCPEKDLIEYHHTLGRDIRNTYDLWHNTILSTPVVYAIHPDDFSMRVVKELHKRALARFRKQLCSLK